jgi:hypothetical protein
MPFGIGLRSLGDRRPWWWWLLVYASIGPGRLRFREVPAAGGPSVLRGRGMFCLYHERCAVLAAACIARGNWFG